MEKNQEFIVDIVGYTSEALGVCRIENRAVFVANALVGEKHQIKIVKITNSAIYAKSLFIISPSKSRAKPQCKYYNQCGGCNCQHMDYYEELRFKLGKVNNSLTHIGKQKISADKIIKSDLIYRYRNKAIFYYKNNQFGFFQERTHNLISIDDCLIQNELSNKVAQFISSLNDPNIISIFIRNTVCVIISRDSFKDLDKLIDFCPELTGVVLCKNLGRENSLLNGEFITLYGSDTFLDKINDYKFNVSPQSFFQINSSQAEKLYNIATDYAGKGNFALELYCGTGTISMHLAKNYKKIYAVEIVNKAIENAKNNSLLNSVNNIEFICDDASNFDTSLNIDTLVVDPPRKGMSIDTIKSISKISPTKIVYISCNPATLARDIQLLENYNLEELCAVDMFPRTSHVETVVLMTKKVN